MLRSCYATKFRFEPDGPLVPVQFYYTPDAPFVPFANSFNVNAWDSDRSRRPIGDQRRRSEGGGNDWVNGAGPTEPCCPEPFGDATAWLYGGAGQPTKWSCDWIQVRGVAQEASGAVGTISVRLAAAGVAQEASGALGGINVCRNLTGTAAEQTGSQGAIAARVAIAGSSSGAETATGTIARTVSMSGTAAEATGSTGSTATTQNVSGSASGAETATGTITVNITPTNPLITGCDPCSSTGIYQNWYLTVAGVSGTGGDDPNGSYHLENLVGSTDCRWFDQVGIVGGLPYWVAGPFGSPTGWQLDYVSSGASVIASYVCDPFDCVGTNVFTLSSSSYGTWPSSLTLTSS
jgi:hypothetical protein